MIEYLIGAGIVGTVIAVADQQNWIPAISNNPSQKWFWDMSRYAPTPTIRIPPPRAISAEQAWKQQQSQQQQQEWAQARRESKYVVTDHSSPATEFMPYRK
jgi:hypothetical protein